MPFFGASRHQEPVAPAAAPMTEPEPRHQTQAPATTTTTSTKRGGLFHRSHPEPEAIPREPVATSATHPASEPRKKGGGLFSHHRRGSSPDDGAALGGSVSSMSSSGSSAHHDHHRQSNYTHSTGDTGGTGGGSLLKGGKAGSLLRRNKRADNDRDLDPSIVAARERVMSAEAAEVEADRALDAARSSVRDARAEMVRLEDEAREDARRAKIKQHQAGELSKRGKGLGRHGL
ncbi:hypothetical protein N3K66_002786 [Trichothecium roseum]|uniref:Uncharacterized protein n=1 Tax=Trichothecium roseum TaxID=47278 RepID=A0ACC0VB55_9HYPO|nr:hypothetical protein N3K66_002786 [Trichothecium roseum]